MKVDIDLGRNRHREEWITLVTGSEGRITLQLHGIAYDDATRKYSETPVRVDEVTIRADQMSMVADAFRLVGLAAGTDGS